MAAWSDPLSNQEGFDRVASAAQVQSTVHLGDLPVIVITAGKDEWEAGFPVDIARALEKDWIEMQHELLGLSSNITHIIATESIHAIQECQPELVIDMIHKLAHEIDT